MDNNYSKGAFFLIIAIVLFMVVYNSTIGKSYTKKLVANHVVICGSITQMLGGKSISVVYEFYYKGKRYEYTKGSPKKTYDDYKNGKASILIIFQKDNPDNNRILSKEDDFMTYEITEQDTLNVSCN